MGQPDVLNFKAAERQKVKFRTGRDGPSPSRAKIRSKGKGEVGGDLRQTGNRVVSWYITQWRHVDGTFDPSAFDTFETFAASFKFLKKSFYETL